MNINGPVNIIRLEGEINNIKKVLYIFSDIHNCCEDQTNCNIDEAVDIDYYLSKTFLELNNSEKNIDFFLEIDNYMINNYNKPLKNRYIDNITQFFSRNFEIDTNKLVKQSSKYKNIRFHFSDIRDNEYILSNYINKININFNKLIYSNYIINLNDNNIFLQNSIFQLDELNKIAKELLIYFYKDYYINKIKNKINNNQVKNILHKYLDIYYNNIKNTKKILKKYYNEITKITNNYKKFDFFDIKKIIKKIYNPIIQLNNKLYIEYTIIQLVLLMDLYFLRRFLDKDYITNTILYCGGLHTLNIIYILVNEFKFKITHSTSDINNINKIITSKNKYELILKYKIQPLINNKTIIQCSDISSFPKNFS